MNNDKHSYVTKQDHCVGKMSKCMNQILPQRTDLKSSVSQFSHSVLPTISNHIDCTTSGLLVHHQFPEPTQTYAHQFGDAIQPSHPLSFPSLSALKLPSIRVFSNESVVCIRWLKYWSFSFTISPSSEYWGLISFRADWFDLLAVQGTHKSLLQHHSSKASIPQCSALFIVQLSQPYMSTRKT